MAKDKSVNLKQSVRKRFLLIAAYGIPLLLLAAFGGYYFKKYNDLKNHPVSAEQATAEEETRTIREVGKLYDLPKDEKPTIATVKDKEALKKQYPGFFDKAENGDKLLVYQNAKLAILYRPTTKQLIKVGPLQVQSNPVVKVIGSETDRANIEKQLKDAKLNVTASGASKGTLSGITVVDVSGQNTDLVKSIASLVKGQVGNLPAGEDKPEGVDILVFVGPTQ
jgi:hypothetical protein